MSAANLNGSPVDRFSGDRRVLLTERLSGRWVLGAALTGRLAQHNAVLVREIHAASSDFVMDNAQRLVVMASFLMV